jgi:hypothetical protein
MLTFTGELRLVDNMCLEEVDRNGGFEPVLTECPAKADKKVWSYTSDLQFLNLGTRITSRLTTVIKQCLTSYGKDALRFQPCNPANHQQRWSWSAHNG